MAVATPTADVERSAFSSRPVTVIEPPRRWVPLDLRELWDQRELVYFLAWRDIKVRYKQTALGASWAILQPVFGAALFTLFFGRLGGIPSDGVPYGLWSFTGLVPWTFFAQGLQQSANSLVINQNLLRKIYFPRLALPAGTVLSTSLDGRDRCPTHARGIARWQAALLRSMQRLHATHRLTNHGLPQHARRVFDFGQLRHLAR